MHQQRRIIAVDIDDTLNEFSQTLQTLPIPYDPASRLTEEAFGVFMARVRRGEPESADLLSTDYTYFRHRVHDLCHRAAPARAGAVRFMEWLRSEGWRIVICTRRDLRRSEGATRTWLAGNGIPFDDLFMAGNKVVFCRAWGIGLLVDDDELSIVHGPAHGVDVYYPVMAKHRSPGAGAGAAPSLPAGGARGFTAFEEVIQWIRDRAS